MKIAVGTVGIKFDGTLECVIEMRDAFDYKFRNYRFQRNFSDSDNKLLIQDVGIACIGDWVILSNEKYRICQTVKGD